MDIDMKKEAYKRKNRLWIYGIITLFFTISILGFVGFQIASHLGEGALVQANGSKIGGTFRIVSLGGSIVTEGDFRGDNILFWFVDPRAPKEEIAPILEALDAAIEDLKKENISIRPIILSLQSGDLDIDDLKDNLMAYAPHIMPFYATENMVRAMTHLFQVPLEKIQGDGKLYYKSAPHFIVMDKNDHYIGQFQVTPSEQIIKRTLEGLLDKENNRK